MNPKHWKLCGLSSRCKPDSQQLAEGYKQAANVSPLNARVLKEAYKKYGRKVDRGECWDVANRAFQKAGAKAPDRYVWSNNEVTLKECSAGDVLQFSWAKFKKDGWWKNAGSAASKGAHTSVVFNNKGHLVLSVLEQNVGGIRKTMFNTYNFGAMTSGTVKCYRPDAADSAEAPRRTADAGRSEKAAVNNGVNNLSSYV